MSAFSAKCRMRMSLINEYGLEPSCDDGAEPERKLSPLAEAMFVIKMVQSDGTPSFVQGHDGLAIGSIGCAYNKQSLVDAGITHILCLTNLSRLKFPELFIYKRVAMRDSLEQNISDVLVECLEFIDCALARGRILVHCYKGESRCATLCIAYLMRRHGMSPDDALSLIRRTRPQACPNIHFMMSLRRLGQCDSEAAETNTSSANVRDDVKM